MPHFTYFLQQKNIRESTSKRYIQVIEKVLESCDPLTKECVETYLMSKVKEGCKNSSINRYIQALRIYGQYEGIEWLKTLKYWKEDVYVAETLEDAEIEAILNCKRPITFPVDQWNRWSLFLNIVCFSGMRGSNACTLQKKHIDLKANYIVLDWSKTTPYKAPIAPNIRLMLEKYINELDDDDYLFPSVNNSTRPYIWRAAWVKHFNKRCKLVGINKKVGLHSLRHSLATNLYEEGVQLPDIQRILNHTSIETTQRYIHLSNKSQQKAIKQHRLVKKTLSPEDQLKEAIKDLKESGILDLPGVHYEVNEYRILIEIRPKNQA